MQSGGDLENEERMANIIVKMLQYATKVPLSADDSQNCKRISGIDVILPKSSKLIWPLFNPYTKNVHVLREMY